MKYKEKIRIYDEVVTTVIANAVKAALEVTEHIKNSCKPK